MKKTSTPSNQYPILILLILVPATLFLAGCTPQDDPLHLPQTSPTLTKEMPATSEEPAATEITASEIKSMTFQISGVKKICQLIGDFDLERDQPTTNLTGEQWNLSRTDLGIPFQHQGRTYMLFGDAWDPPDDPIAYTDDPDPDDCLDLVFLQGENGRYQPIQIPGISLGAFEVPTEGISVGDKIYLFAATDHSPDQIMGRSVLSVSEDDGQTFQYLYDFSIDKFINLSIVEGAPNAATIYPGATNDGLVIFGSGAYRESDLYLAIQPASQIDDRSSILYFSGMGIDSKPLWSQAESDADPLFSQPCIGEFSVTFNPYLQKWILLYNCHLEPFRGIILRLADQPWGPWTAPIILFDPWEDEGYCHFIHTSWEHQECDQVYDPGRENEWGGEYGPYQFDSYAWGDDTSTTIYYTMSTWNPYTVVLMKAEITAQK